LELDHSMTIAATPAPHARDAESVAREFASRPNEGLDDEEAGLRLRRFGRNELEERRPPSVWRALWGAATEPFVLLLAAAGIGAVALGEIRDGILVLIGLVPIVGADVATTYRSERALAALREAVAPRAHVLRGGRRKEVAVGDIVPGDVLLLASGDVVPADARVLAGGGMLVDRSVLTGESVPEMTDDGPDPEDATIADRRAMVYAGTSVVGGRGSAMVVATGTATELGTIAGTLGGEERRR
jgi:Ca2+-transporting ATPase